MNIDIEKIENGFVVTIGSVKTFADVPEAVCGILAEWALKLCENMEKGNPTANQLHELTALKQYTDMVRQMEETQKQNQYTPLWAQPPMIEY